MSGIFVVVLSLSLFLSPPPNNTMVSQVNGRKREILMCGLVLIIPFLFPFTTRLWTCSFWSGARGRRIFSPPLWSVQSKRLMKEKGPLFHFLFSRVMKPLNDIIRTREVFDTQDFWGGHWVSLPRNRGHMWCLFRNGKGRVGMQGREREGGALHS